MKPETKRAFNNAINEFGLLMLALILLSFFKPKSYLDITLGNKLFFIAFFILDFIFNVYREHKKNKSNSK